MPEKDFQQIEILDSRRTSVRVAIGVAVAAALVFGWFSIRWQLGDMLAVHTTPTDARARATVRAAFDFAPRDPLVNWLLISADEDFASKNNLERVVRLSPADFHWWIELGREREQAGDDAQAEKALQKAVELAPKYTFPRWQLGNFYLRRNRADEAFRELTATASGNTIFREQVFSIAWEYFNQNTAKLEQIAGDAPEIRADLAKFYAAKGRAEDSLRAWNSLSDADKEANANDARTISQALYDKQLFRAANEFMRQSGVEPDARFETIQNAGFEKSIGEAKDAFFNWKVAPVEKMDVKLDPTQKHEGNRSLRISFDGYAQPTLSNIYQIVTVEPKARYRLTVWLRTENLKTGGAPQIEIYNIGENKTIAASAPFPVGTTDWRQIKIDFTAPEKADAVAVSMTRAYCGDNCPIFGAFWYDDFKLVKIGNQTKD